MLLHGGQLSKKRKQGQRSEAGGNILSELKNRVKCTGDRIQAGGGDECVYVRVRGGGSQAWGGLWVPVCVRRESPEGFEDRVERFLFNYFCVSSPSSDK